MSGRAIMMLVLGFSFLIGYSIRNLTTFSTRSISNMAVYNGMTTSHDVAVAGANVGLAKLYQDTSYLGSFSQTFDGTSLSGSFQGSVVYIPGGKKLQSISTYSAPGYGTLHDTVEVTFTTVRNNSFTLFAWMTNFEGNVFWITQDTVWGRVHSNGNIHISGSPVFMKKLTTAKNLDPPRVGRGQNQAIFKAGYETGVADIDFPSDLSDLFNAGTAGGRRYTSDIWVTLTAGTGNANEGMAYIRTAPGGTIIDSIRLNDPSFNGALIGTGNVHVSGIVNGRLDIGANGNVIVEDDIRYLHNPLTGPSNDLLGLVAENNVIVAENAANNNNCAIDASIFARNGSFMAEDATGRPVSGTLNVLGSIVQYQRGAVGQFNYGGNTIVNGFSKRYRYDDRLEDPAFRPPFYPGYYTRTLAISDWWESYGVMKFQ